MKKLFLFFGGLCLAAGLQAQTIATTAGGTLYSAIKIKQLDVKTITSLTVAGPIDARDFVFLRDSMPLLSSLVLGDAKIVAYIGAGTDSDASVYNANTIPAFALSKNNFNTVLNSLVLPSNITAIDKGAFMYMSALKTIEIPAGVTTIGSFALAANSAAITVSTKNTSFIADGGVLYNFDKTKIIACPTSIVGAFQIPTSVNEIGMKAFYYCDKITSINASTVKFIGESAFQSSGITSFDIPNGVTVIEPSSFSYCNKLTKVTIPASVTTINDNAFAYSGLTSITIPSTVSSMGNAVLAACTSLVTVDFKAPVTALGENFFISCNNLNNINLPTTITSVGRSAFDGCSRITKLSIPTSVGTIYANAFYNCGSLQSFIVNNPKPVSITANDIYYIPVDKCTLYVPKGAKKAYQQATTWKNFKRIVEMGSIVEKDTLYVPATASTGAIRFINPTSNWTAQTISSPAGMLSFNQHAVNGEDSIPGTVNENTGKERMAIIAVSDGGDYSQRVYIIQDTEVKVNKQILDTTINLSDISKAWPLASFFSYLGSGTVSYSVSSDNDAVATAVIHGQEFGLVPYSTGTCTISLTAKTSKGGFATIEFKATVSGSIATNCKLAIDQTITPVSCNGTNTGAIELFITNATGPCTYKWSNTCSDKKLVNVGAGTYSVVVRDSVGCAVTKSFTLKNSSKLNINATVTAPSCGSANGQVALVVSGGKAAYTYKWDDNSTAASITNKVAGIYSVTVTDANNCSQTQQIEVNGATAPSLVLDSVRGARCSKAVGAIYVTTIGGKATDTYKWSSNASTEDLTNALPGTYTLSITSADGCTASLTASVPTKKFARPQIAMVTVGEISQHNIVLWLKEKTDAISYYTVYREGDRNEYVNLGTVPYSQMSMYVDNVADTKAQSFRYYITASDSCGNQSQMSKEFKTMHLTTKEIAKDQIQLSWDDYEGAGFYRFEVGHLDVNNQWQVIASLPASAKRITFPKTGLNNTYRVQIVFEQITADALKSDTGPFSQSLSNMSEASLVSISEDEQQAGIIYPNPTSDAFTVDIEDATAVTVSNLDGQVLIAEKVANKQSVSVANLAKGAYIVSIESKQGTVKQTIIKN